MESVAFFEKKLSLLPQEFNEVKSNSMDDILLKKAKETMENKCSEQGFVLPGSIVLHSRSMGYFEAARFTGDAVYYVKLEGKVIYPVDGIRVTGEVIRKNKMGLYVNYRDAIRIQIPRDLHLGNEVFDNVQVGDTVQVELKRSKFAINDLYILSSGVFINIVDSSALIDNIEEVNKEAEAEAEAEAEEEEEEEEESEVEEDDEEDEDS
jgi:DNA-directed RNA polymerase subunit E'/Rpb7